MQAVISAATASIGCTRQYSLALAPATTVMPGCRHASVRAVENALLHAELPAALSVVPGGFDNVRRQLQHCAASS